VTFGATRTQFIPATSISYHFSGCYKAQKLSLSSSLCYFYRLMGVEEGWRWWWRRWWRWWWRWTWKSLTPHILNALDSPPSTSPFFHHFYNDLSDILRYFKFITFTSLSSSPWIPYDEPPLWTWIIPSPPYSSKPRFYEHQSHSNTSPYSFLIRGYQSLSHSFTFLFIILHSRQSYFFC